MHRWVVRLVIATYLLVFMIELGYFGIQFSKSIKLQMFGEKVMGTVVALVPERSCYGSSSCLSVKYNYRKIVVFTPKGSSKTYHVKDPQFLFSSRRILTEEELKANYSYLLDTHSHVVYNQADPANATVASAIWHETALAVVLLVITVAGGVLVVKLFRKKTTKKSKK